MTRRVLIANRGEIAIRIARAAAGLGMESVGVYAPVDALSLHTRATTRAVELPGADPVGSYLDGEVLVAVAVDSGCDCVHPGYGFLAENAGFAELCHDAGLTFVGPSPATLRLFGDKVKARQFARSAGVPVVAGSEEPVGTADAAAAQADRLGYPVMLKAAAGGGGRGMREVTGPAGLAEAFERCRSEAEAAFGDGTLFVERLLHRPRHIEVQILGAAGGEVAHLYERDCSIQSRHQKVIEIAPAPGLDEKVRDALLRDAVELGRAAGYVGAGTVEFLVLPESGEHFFIECNPRIQVEHTVTEQVTGVDLVDAQFRLAAGASLSDLGLRPAPPPPRRFAVEARVVATGPGTITAYREPSGPGVRVDGCGYMGYSPPPNFDPLLAKVVCSSGSAGSFTSAVDRARRALDEFHISGLPSNLAQLRAILSHPDVRAGEARTSLLTEEPGLMAAPGPGAGDGALGLLEEQAALLRKPGPAGRASTPVVELPVGPGQHAVASPLEGEVVEVRARPGDVVRENDAVVVVGAMKMETVVPAGCRGVLAAIRDLAPGDRVRAGETLAVVTLSGSPTGPDRDEGTGAGTWGSVLDDVRSLQLLAGERLAPGSEDPGVVRQRARGKLTCRERIDLLLDEGSFRETGSAAGFASYDEDGRIAAFTPANHVGGWGTVTGRPVVVCADDFTSRGGHSDGAIGAKSGYLDRLSIELRVPSVRMLDGSSGGGSVATMVPQQRREGESNAKESSGAITSGQPRVRGAGGSFLPGHLGSTMYTEQLATVPVVNMLLGSVVGLGAAKAVLGHFSVMVRDLSQLFVAGPPVVQHAMGYDITKEDLGGWQIHCQNGSVDNLADTEESAAEQVRRFLSYLPASVYELPPLTADAAPDPVDRREEELLSLIPRRRTTTFDIRRAIELVADAGSFFEIGPLWGTDQVTGLARFNGFPVGVLASDCRHPNGGAMTADGCRKLSRHIDLCDLFHLPIVNLVDSPGFAVGLEHETAGTIRAGGEWMVAFAQARVPIFTVVMRRSFGVAGNNFATPRSRASVRVAWPSADVGGIPPEGGIEAAYKRQLSEAADPDALRAELYERIERARGPLGPLSRFEMEEMIDPRDTRPLVCDWAGNAYRILGHADQLGPRPLQFRP